MWFTAAIHTSDGREESLRAFSVHEILLDKVGVRSSGTPGPSFIKALICGEATQSESSGALNLQCYIIRTRLYLYLFYVFPKKSTCSLWVHYWPKPPRHLVQRQGERRAQPGRTRTCEAAPRWQLGPLQSAETWGQYGPCRTQRPKITLLHRHAEDDLVSSASRREEARRKRGGDPFTASGHQNVGLWRRIELYGTQSCWGYSIKVIQLPITP